MIQLYQPKTVIDVGCGIGDFVSWLLRNNIDAFGIEGSNNVERHLAIPVDHVFIRDLRDPLDITDRYDVAMCIEVAEHIEEEFADQFVLNLCQLSDILVMTIAGPGQEGHGHYNLQEKAYWIEKFNSQGYFRHEYDEGSIRYPWGPNPSHRWIRAIDNNLIIFKKG